MKKRIKEALLYAAAAAMCIGGIECGRIIADKVYAAEPQSIVRIDEVEVPLADEPAPIAESTISGTYTREDASADSTTSIMMNDDHTGMVMGKESFPITWDNVHIYSNGFPYVYAVVGDELFVNVDGVILTFTK